MRLWSNILRFFRINFKMFIIMLNIVAMLNSFI